MEASFLIVIVNHTLLDEGQLPAQERVGEAEEEAEFSLIIRRKRCIGQNFLQSGCFEVVQSFWKSHGLLQGRGILNGSHVVA